MNTRIPYLVALRGKKLTEISSKTGIPYPTLSGYNQGIRIPKRENAEKLAKYFGVSVGYLLGDEKEPNLINPGDEPLIPTKLVQELSSINYQKEEVLQEYLELTKKEQVILKQIKEII